MRSQHTLFALSFALMTAAQDPAWTTPPRLVVGVVVDQMRTDYLYRYWDNFGEGGFKRLVHEGAFLRDAHYTYLYTKTAAGHASIYTGSTPSIHGIMANRWFDPVNRVVQECVRDSAVKGVGAPEAISSPHLLLATTLGDEIERRTDGRGHTIGISRKDRSAILPIGRTGDAAYWMSMSTGHFVTSDWYGGKALPDWVRSFNAKEQAQRYMERTWEPLLPLERYHQVLPDDNPYETPLRAGTRPAFPYPFGEWRKAGAPMELFMFSPWCNTLITDMAFAAMEHEGLGHDATTDLLAISYSSPDDLGHELGIRAIEMEDMYIRLDREIARLLDHLDAEVGPGRYTLFLTADHGVVDVPQYLKDLRGSAGFVPSDSLRNWVVEQARSRGLKAADGGPLIERIYGGQVYMRDAQWCDREKVDAVARILMQHPAVAFAIPVARILERPTGDDRTDRLRNSVMPSRSGEILYTLHPGHSELYPGGPHSGTEHDTGWNYDSHVPVLFFGQGIAPGEVVRRTAVADIAPTLSMIIGCALPDGAVGEAIPEVLMR
ncbi:MAG: alkaline phosphatase family protein [Flavobacteriales bacterium]|nr:alkaline phosphatase family protein [Flavobacteriales bacterium]